MTFGAIVLFVLIVVARCLRVVPAHEAWVVERLGRYHSTIHAGLHWMTPAVDHVAKKFSLLPKEQELSDTAISRDNVPIAITTRMTWQVVDPERAAYATADVQAFTADLVRMETRRWISEQNAEDVRLTTRELQSAVLRGVAEPAEGVGVKVSELQVREVKK